MYKWLVYGNDGKHPQADPHFYHRREFCFTLDGDIFVRYQSFKTGDEMRQAISSKIPAKIDIGPVYNVDPQRRGAFAGQPALPAGTQTGFHPVERELVFDIDLTDYDDVRTCGDGGHICSRCWPFMALAIKLLDRALREDFGFEHVLWVFSGRRGVHAWVCDARARALKDAERSALAAYLTLYKGQEKGMAKLGTGSAKHHPAVERALQQLKTHWVESILPEQRLLEDSAKQEAVLSYLPDPNMRDRLRNRWSHLPEIGQDISVARWQQLEREADKAKTSKLSVKLALRRACRDILFAFAYPRLDVEVSKKMNHLLKAPFCVHPKTGKVCVPIDPATAEQFDPVNGVPTVAELLTELDKQALAAHGWEKTSLKPAVDLFCGSFLEPLQKANRDMLAAKARMAKTLKTSTAF
eukprot:jgi/Astpho2/2499/e_gw1.00048.196.1_t